MVSAIDQVTAKPGEKRIVQQAETITATSPEHQQDEKNFILSCLKPRGTRFLSEIIDDQAILRFARFVRLRNMSEGCVGTYIADIYKVCKMLNMMPTQIVAELAQLDAPHLQTWFDNLAEYYLFKREKPVRGSTMRTTHYALLKLLEANNVDINILEKIRVRFQVKKREPLPFTRDEVKAILKVASRSRRNTLWIWLLCQSFAREGLIYELTYGDFIDILEGNMEAGLVWVDGEAKRTKERISHDIPVSPEVVKALRARKQEIEAMIGTMITKANAHEFPITSYEEEPRRKLTYSNFLIQVRRIVHHAGVQGSSYSTGNTHRYQKDVHTGFRGFCFTQWKEGNTWLAHYFAGHTPPRDAFNYVHYETVEPKQKLAEYLKCRPRPLNEIDIIEEACTQLSNLGFDIDSNIRELLQDRLPGGERSVHRKSCDAGQPENTRSTTEETESITFREKKVIQSHA